MNKKLTDSALQERHLNVLWSNSCNFSALAMSDVSLSASTHVTAGCSRHRNWSRHYNITNNSTRPAKHAKTETLHQHNTATSAQCSAVHISLSSKHDTFIIFHDRQCFCAKYLSCIIKYLVLQMLINTVVMILC